MNETTEHKVHVEHTDLTGQALLERIRALAVKHGLDSTKLIGGNQVIEATVVADGTR